MAKVKFKIDIANVRQSIKEHEGDIPAGTVVEFSEVPENVHHLIKVGVAELQDEAPVQSDGEIRLEDLTKPQLESFNKENNLGIYFQKKATKEEMISAIEAALLEKAAQ
jgi:hypothetical protein